MSSAIGSTAAEQNTEGLVSSHELRDWNQRPYNYRLFARTAFLETPTLDTFIRRVSSLHISTNPSLSLSLSKAFFFSFLFFLMACLQIYHLLHPPPKKKKKKKEKPNTNNGLPRDFVCWGRRACTCLVGTGSTATKVGLDFVSLLIWSAERGSKPGGKITVRWDCVQSESSGTSRTVSKSLSNLNNVVNNKQKKIWETASAEGFCQGMSGNRIRMLVKQTTKKYSHPHPSLLFFFFPGEDTVVD